MTGMSPIVIDERLGTVILEDLGQMTLRLSEAERQIRRLESKINRLERRK